MTEIEANEDAIVEELGDRFEEALRLGKFDEVDRMLDDLVVDAYPPHALLTVITLTWYGKVQLNRRTSFLERAESSLRARLGDERAENLLRNRR